MARPTSPRSSRRTILKGALAGAATGLAGFPYLSLGQSDVIRIGHLTPRTGFLGPLGEFAVQAADMAVDEINAAGGVNGRKIELLKEDSVNPQTASTKAERMIERDKVACIVGEISSASCLTISQVADRTRTLFINTGGNSDELRGKGCKKYMFHIESQNSMYVRTCGRSLMAQGLVKGKRWYSLTADYAFGHDLLRVAKRFMAANGGDFAADKLVPTDVTDFSPLMLEIRNAKPDLVISNLAGNQITNFLKQYTEFGLPFPVAGFGFDTAVAWGAGKGQLRRDLAARVASPDRHAGLEEIRRGLHEALQPSAREPGLGRLQRDEAGRTGDGGDEVDRLDHAGRALREGRALPADEDARRLLPQGRPPDDARDVHGAGAAGGAAQEQLGHLHLVAAGPRPERVARGDRDDRRRDRVQARLIA
jgi:ABC-type branched-subunit amino acid transport system substrate-binding protein